MVDIRINSLIGKIQLLPLLLQTWPLRYKFAKNIDFFRVYEENNRPAVRAKHKHDPKC